MGWVITISYRVIRCGLPGVLVGSLDHLALVKLPLLECQLFLFLPQGTGTTTVAVVVVAVQKITISATQNRAYVPQNMSGIQHSSSSSSGFSSVSRKGVRVIFLPSPDSQQVLIVNRE